MERETYFGYLIRGDVLGALGYLQQFPEQAGLYQRYIEFFEQEVYVTYDLDAELNEVLIAYQRYYRDIFYLRVDHEAAEVNLKNRLMGLLGIADSYVELSALEQNQLSALFRERGFHFMGGRTSGYYGPYVWKTSETVTYEVELPDGIQSYTVKLLDGFITRGWIDFLSFGVIGPGGWADGDGYINCVKSAWDLDSERFRVSLLKHEAQHAKDLSTSTDMSSIELEYRAKLVELIYSSDRMILEQFIQEADDSDSDNGHAAAAFRIVRGFTDHVGELPLSELGIEQIQRIARSLYDRNTKGNGG